MDTATSHIYQFGNTKEEILRFVEQVQVEVAQGMVDPLKFHGIMNTLIKGLQKAVEINAENLDTSQSVEAYGYEFTPKEAGVRYDFTNCNHPDYIACQKLAKELDGKRKSLEALLKSLKSSITMVDEKTGEVFQVFPPSRVSKSILQVSW